MVINIYFANQLFFGKSLTIGHEIFTEKSMF
jgi:hypothetical protein